MSKATKLTPEEIKEHHKKSSDNYRKSNLKYYSDKQIEYYQKNKDKVRARQKAYYQNNKAKREAAIQERKINLIKINKLREEINSKIDEIVLLYEKTCDI